MHAMTFRFYRRLFSHTTLSCLLLRNSLHALNALYQPRIYHTYRLHSTQVPFSLLCQSTYETFFCHISALSFFSFRLVLNHSLTYPLIVFSSHRSHMFLDAKVVCVLNYRLCSPTRWPWPKSFPGLDQASEKSIRYFGFILVHCARLCDFDHLPKRARWRVPAASVDSWRNCVDTEGI